MSFYLLHYIDIDIISWRWGDIRKTVGNIKNIDDLVQVSDKYEGKNFAIVAPAAGSPKYSGFHGGINLADALCAAGVIDNKSNVILVLKEDNWQDNLLAAFNAFNGDLTIAYVPDRIDFAEPLLHPDEVMVKNNRPPEITISSRLFSNEGKARFASSMTYKGTQAFMSHLDSTTARSSMHRVIDFLNKNGKQVPDAVTCGQIEIPFNEYEFIDGFGTWTLGKTVIIGNPFEKEFDAIKYIQMMSDLSVIWKNVLTNALYEINNESDRGTAEFTFGELDEKYGIASMVRAYLNGVPIADIIA